MISTISGIVTVCRDQEILLQSGALGFSLMTPDSTVFEPNKPTMLFTYLHWNQEQGPSLYGFATEVEKQVFLLAISCSGVGPKMALSLLCTLKPSGFIKAIQNSDVKAMSAAHGIGAKKAEQIIVYLRHKIDALVKSGILIDNIEAISEAQTLSQVLTSLHYSRTEIAQALDYVRSKKEPQSSFDQQVRMALTYLSKQL